MSTVQTAGGQIACWDRGRGQALVAIHGGGTPGELLRTDLAELSRECRVITYDRRGYGQSSESPRDWAAHRDDAVAVIDQLGAAPAVISAVSVAAIVALALALERPELVAGLVLIDPVSSLSGPGGWALRRERAKVRLLRRWRGEQAAADSWLRFTSSYSTGGSAWDKAVPQRRDTILESAGGILDDLDTPDGDALIDHARLGSIDVPVTIVDTELSPDFMHRSTERLRELMPQARALTFSESSHVAIMDAREQLLQVLRDTLAAARDSTAGGA
jgi:pimeloyl-ACP methyl ester carboxylesterase